MSGVCFLSGWAGTAERLFPGAFGGRARIHRRPSCDGDEAALVALEAALARPGAATLAGWSTGGHMILKHAAQAACRAFSKVVLRCAFYPLHGFSFPARLVTRSMIARMASGTPKPRYQPSGISGAACGFTDAGRVSPRAWALPLDRGPATICSASEATPGWLPYRPAMSRSCTATTDRIVRPAGRGRGRWPCSGRRAPGSPIPGGHSADQRRCWRRIFVDGRGDQRGVETRAGGHLRGVFAALVNPQVKARKAALMAGHARAGPVLRINWIFHESSHQTRELLPRHTGGQLRVRGPRPRSRDIARPTGGLCARGDQACPGRRA